ncbi:hypothetical protein [Burkholderia cepacia]|uniref:hypothetical protein n=1 Tax=Burkholderia cepacia TaxID=292 RepID=UPI00158C8B19|nr:hypothetical protein [Burkholderia cepacia]
MTTSHNAGYRRMIGYIQPSAVERLDLGTPETIFPVRSTSGTIPVYIDPTRSNEQADVVQADASLFGEMEERDHRMATRNAKLRPQTVERYSDMSVRVVFRSAHETSLFYASCRRLCGTQGSERVPHRIRAIVHAQEIWCGGVKLAIATSNAIAVEIAEALNARLERTAGAGGHNG